MIRSKRDLASYLEADLASNGISRWHFYDRWRYPLIHFQRHLRRTEFVLNCIHIGPLRALARWRLREHGIRLGFSIYPNNFGPGLSIAHWGTIVINQEARIGARCRIHPSTCMGSRDTGAPTLGDDCYVGPGAKLFGGIVLGDKTTIGANAVVNKSFPDGHVTLVGMPAKPTQLLH